MDRFDIEKVLPIRRHGLWMAEVVVRTPEQVDGNDVAQVARLFVRFSYDDSGSAEGLLEAAYAAAKNCLALTSSYLADRSLAQIRDEEQAAKEEQQRSIFGSFATE